VGGQESLFYDDVRCDSGSGDLILLSRPDRPLSKSQRTFNRLVARVESLRTRLQSETRRLDQALALRSASSPAAGASDSTAERLCSPLLVVSEPEAVETANRPKSATDGHC